MEEVSTLRNLTQYVMYFVAFKLKAIPELLDVDKSAISQDLVENMRKVVWVERILFRAESSKFTSDHRIRMSSKIDLYITYNLYLCHLMKNCFKHPDGRVNAFEVFIRMMTALFSIAATAPLGRFLEAVGLAATIFTHYYEEFRSEFNCEGGFENFSKFIARRDSVSQFSTVEALEEAGKTPYEIANQLKMKTTVLIEVLSEDISELIIESHIPTLYLRDVVINSGSGIIHKMIDSRENEKETPKDKVHPGKNSEVLDDSRKPSNSGTGNPGNKIQQPWQGQNSSDIAKTAYLQARKHIKEFHAKCQKLEQLLDFIFEEIP